MLAHPFQSAARARARDLAFLLRLRTANEADLMPLWRAYNHGQVELWKLVAIERAFRRLGMEPPPRSAWRIRKEQEALRHIHQPKQSLYGVRSW